MVGEIGSKLMSDVPEKYDYEPFADTDEYKKVNDDIITTWVEIMLNRGMEKVDKLLDVATGAGTMVQLFFTKLPENWKKSLVMCLDQSSEAIKLAQKRLESQIEKLNFINSPIENLELPENTIDIAVWGNGIHYLNQKSQIYSLKRIRQVLKPGGWLFFNTAFYEEARPEDTLPFYRTQVKNAVQFLREKGISRQKTDTRANEAGSFLPKSYYEELVSEAGFKLIKAQEFAAELQKDAWEHISGFQQYAAGALRGYPIDDASEAMKLAVGPALSQHGKTDDKGNLSITRNWLAISARAK